MPDKIKEAFEATKDNGIFLDEEDFRGSLSKEPKAVFELFKSDKKYVDLFLDYDDFENSLGLKKKEQAIPFDGQQFGGKSEEPLLPLTSSTVSPSVSKQPKSTIPLESTGAKSKQAPFQNVDISKPELEVAEVKYDKVQERNRIQNYSQGLQKVQIDAAKKIKQRDDLFAGIEQMQVDLEASKSNPEQYNALIPQYNELVNSAKAITNDISADFNKIDIFEKGIGVTELKRQINEDTIGNRALEGVNSAKRILLEAFPATVQVASYLTQRSRGIDPATAEKVSIDIAENGFPNIKRWSRELAEENEDLRSVFDQTTAWDVLTEKDSSLLEKDWAKIGELSAKELVQTLPATLAIMASYVNPIAGVTTTIMGTAGMELEELQGSDMTPDAKIANALTKGGLEYATEKVFGSIPMLKRAIGLKSKAGQEAYQNIVLETWNRFASKMGFAADVIEEVGSEMLNTIGGNYTDYLSGKTTEDDLYKGLGETFTTSLTMASTLSGAGRAAKYGNKKINELRTATKKLKEISESQETTPEVLQVIQDKVVENNEKIAEEAKKEKQAFDSMDDRTFGEVTTLVQETQSLEQQLENNEVPEDVIPLVEEKIKKGYEQIDELTKQAKETNIEATGEVAQEGEKTENEIKVEELRAQEQAEKDATDPNDQEKLDEIYNRYDKLITPLLESTKEKAVEEDLKDVGYHGGNLQGKSDYLTQGYRGDMPFTGYYFFSDRKRAESRGNRSQLPNKEVSVVDFSEYNLLKPTTNEYWAAKSGLKNFEDRLLRDGIDAAFEVLERRYGLKDSYPKLYEEIVANRSEIEKVAKDWVENELNNIDTKKRIERLETIILKKLGYEGVDVRGLKESNGDASPDSSSEGSVIFDIKPSSVKESPASKTKEAEAKEQEASEIVSTPEIEAGKQEVDAVKKGKIKTTNPIRLFKGLFGKRNVDGTRKSAHPNVKGVFSAVDEKIAERYRGEDGIGTFDIPAGTTIETIRLQNKNVPVSKFREQETEAINASDAQIVKLITLDAKGAEEQYIIKDPALIKMMQKPEDATKAEPKEEVKKEKKTPPQNVLDIAKETGLSPQEVENTYKKYDDTKSIEEITIEDYNSARAAGNEQKLENSKKAFEALLKADSDSPTAKKKAAKIKEEVSKETFTEASEIMNNIDNIRQQLLDAGVIKSINCKWGK
jgi:hypothetical protein